MRSTNVKENNNIRISIIMTVKNCEKYLKTSIDSVLKQSLKDIELVIVDGNSNDKTLDIINEYQKSDKRIIVYEQDKPGIGYAKNYGIEHAHGEFVTFLDADDYYIDDYALENLYDSAIKNQVKICGAFRNLDKNGEIIPAILHRAFLVGFPKGRMFYYNDFQYDYHFHSYIYNREFLLSKNIRFENSKVYDDTHFFIRVMNEANRFYVIPVEFYCYRLHSSYNWDNEQCYDALNNLIDQLRYTSVNKLGIGHFITIQRINYEYGKLFEKHLANGDLKILELLLKAQNSINSELLNQTLLRDIDKNVLNAMEIYNYSIGKIIENNKNKYVLNILLNFITSEKSKLNNNAYLADDVYGSITYKVGNCIVWIPRHVKNIVTKNYKNISGKKVK